eukprot:CAMPEP_0201685710 /NCGR_PEP_ID=MMETSP0578-20130828/402_1 /ASSEMBLY_ACC=CAM_ASM_000663 /TAXON_ID=267565 /ORGANISM="Skeletonema grethea, Strain CCMP 1804" /LENGTH=128 /DNA_ID=CAMNT_0048169663 /DNA_START=85 /DNA_END=469 /DNA_ORIENTATION=-
MKLFSTILLASGLGAAMAADSINLRVGEESRQLADADYSSSSSSSSSTSFSAGTWMWYLMLNGLAAPFDFEVMAAIVDVKCHHAPGHIMNQAASTKFVDHVVVLLTFLKLMCLTFITEVVGMAEMAAA